MEATMRAYSFAHTATALLCSASVVSRNSGHLLLLAGLRCVRRRFPVSGQDRCRPLLLAAARLRTNNQQLKLPPFILGDLLRQSHARPQCTRGRQVHLPKTPTEDT
ncbi:hypothetical protein VPH35_082093 [Triticum aestivum]